MNFHLTMEGGSNGGLLYHEVQESKLCAMHCINAVLQGPFFSELDLAALASDLDRKERQMMVEGGVSSGDFLSEESHNVSLVGDFSIQVGSISFLNHDFKKRMVFHPPFLTSSEYVKISINIFGVNLFILALRAKMVIFVCIL